LRLNLTEIYQIPDQFLAQKRFMAWCRWVRRVSKKYANLMFAKTVSCAGMIQRHLEGILAYRNRKTTDAFLEGLNSVFCAVKRKARRYRSTDNLITMLYFTADKLRTPASH
jgi:transposase